MGHHHQVLSELRGPTRALRHAIPDAWSAFLTLHEAVMVEGEVPIRLKEAAALAVSVAVHCDGCIAFHARAAARAGATPGEVAEMLGVALLLGGGTATTYAPRAWAAYEEFSAEDAGVPAAT